MRALTTGLCFRFAFAGVVAATLALWLCAGAAEGARLDHARVTPLALETPHHFSVSSQSTDETAFREEEAGFSAYHRVLEQPEGNRQDDAQPRLSIPVITQTLLAAPEESNTTRSGIAQPVELGSNFAILKIPMFATIGFGSLVDPRYVNVYYDDRGWIVAYLAAGEPAASIWRHDSASGENQENSKANEHLEQNLLVLAINEVLNSAIQDKPSLAPVSHGVVGYYDWENPDCNAFVLFSNQSSGGQSEPVNFVIPPKIGDIQASAAVLVTSRYSSSGDDISASVTLDRESIVTAGPPALLNVAAFDIPRPTDENGKHQTGLHKMSVTVSEGDTATGVVMLLYDKPGS